VAGHEEDKGLGGARPWRIRPHWWLVLAVSLSLLALVAATTSDHPGSAGRRQPPRSLQPTLPRPTRPTPTTTSTTSSTVPTTTTVTFSTSPIGPVTAPARGNDVSALSSTPPIPTTTTTAVTTTTTGLAAAPTQPARPATDKDYSTTLQQPNEPTASYKFYGVGSMTVSVKWDYATPLSFTVSCPGGGTTKQGASPLTIVIPNAGGLCSTSVTETLVQYTPVDVTFLIYPTDGG
jgi:hypothetical protein